MSKRLVVVTVARHANVYEEDVDQLFFGVRATMESLGDSVFKAFRVGG